LWAGYLSRYSDWLRAGQSGIESLCGCEIFRTCLDRPWGPLSLQYNGYRAFPGGKDRAGRDADPSPPSSVVGHGRVELYLYSPYGPYGLYRASVPVQGSTLLLPFICLVIYTSCHNGPNHVISECLNTLRPELNPIYYLLALLAHDFLHVSRIRVKLLILMLLMSYIHGAPILDVSRSYTTTQHSR
jgi:hypothetical protein